MVFQCLVLLNLIISIIGETYGQVKENFDIIDLKERIDMLLELNEEGYIMRQINNWCRQRIARLFRRNALTHEVAAYRNPQSKLGDRFMLVVEKFDGNSDSAVTIKDVKDKLNEMKKELNSKLEGEVDTLKNEIGSVKNEIDSLKKVMNSKLEGEIASLKSEVENKISSSEARIVNNLRVIIQDMFSEVAEVKLKK